VYGLTTVLDHAMLALLAASLLFMTGVRTRWDPAAAIGGTTRTRIATIRPVLPLLILFGLAFLLQLPISAPFYELVPGAMFLQFPWRLLALITPSLVVCAVVLADTALPSDIRLFALGAASAWMIAGCGAFVPLQDSRIALDPPALANISFSGFREFEPRIADPLADIQKKLEARWAEAGCSFRREAPAEETTVVSFVTSCPNATLLPLPIYASPVHLVTVGETRPGGDGDGRGEAGGGGRGGLGTSRPCAALADFPALCGAVVPAAQSSLLVRLPTIGSTISRVWRRP